MPAEIKGHKFKQNIKGQEVKQNIFSCTHLTICTAPNENTNFVPKKGKIKESVALNQPRTFQNPNIFPDFAMFKGYSRMKRLAKVMF